MKHTNSFLVVILLPLFALGQSKPIPGKIISEYGKTYQVQAPDFKTDIHSDLKAVFDIGRSFNDSTKVNPLINTAARYLNMHTESGVPFKNLKVALVIHGSAAFDILNNQMYKKKYGIDNPNAPLIKALSEKGVQIILCGQTAAYRKIIKKDVLPEIQFALSAMTALVQLQNNNYRLINF
ncbi:DsrE family protein [Aquimarina sp. 2201CG5-10]|uniref:DsrE family protein n=1 Tax=Aquimarina callyspongiae TaxID=3098150 RepID=UPI002AB5B290|nr:DsrE family protein [Aquimarina sp. 2201CG5-10]MDY8135485.1 DsrE family protein [Aquimarina sp. 2201CG5-10]